jgi:hypothetical protein
MQPKLEGGRWKAGKRQGNAKWSSAGNAVVIRAFASMQHLILPIVRHSKYAALMNVMMKRKFNTIRHVPRVLCVCVYVCVCV